MKSPAVSPEPSTAFSPAILGTWFVNTGSGILSLTLEQLDQAYQRGEVDASTPVFTAGMDAWDTLGHIADLDAADQDEAIELEPSSDDALEISVEPIDSGSFPPTSAGVFDKENLPWSNGPRAESESHTVVRRSTGVVPFPVRKVAGRLADVGASLRLSHPRLAAAGPWLFGLVLSSIFVFSLYELGAAATRPGADAKLGWGGARAATRGDGPAAPIAPSNTRAVSAPSLPARAPAAAELAARSPAPAEPVESAVATLRPIDLRLAAPTRSEARLARRARARASASKASAAKASAPHSSTASSAITASAARAATRHEPRLHTGRKLAKRSEKARSSAFD